MAKRCDKCGQVERRSLPQNNRLHKLFTEMAANLVASDGLYHPHQWWKACCKDRWLGYNEFKKSDGSTIYQLKSTADCSVEELNEFMNQVEKYAAEHGVWLQD